MKVVYSLTINYKYCNIIDTRVLHTIEEVRSVMNWQIGEQMRKLADVPHLERLTLERPTPHHAVIKSSKGARVILMISRHELEF